MWQTFATKAFRLDNLVTGRKRKLETEKTFETAWKGVDDLQLQNCELQQNWMPQYFGSIESFILFNQGLMTDWKSTKRSFYDCFVNT